MVRLNVIEMASPSDDVLTMLMRYAAVNDEGQKAILSSCLVRAMDMVQRYADRALLAGRWRVIATEHDGSIPVYMGGMVENVTDRRGGAVPFEQVGNRVNVDREAYVEVVFSTEVDKADMDVLLPVVLKYATALYDGEDTRVLNEILKEALYA